jgi:hypothetical protein
MANLMDRPILAMGAPVATKAEAERRLQIGAGFFARIPVYLKSPSYGATDE